MSIWFYNSKVYFLANRPEEIEPIVSHCNLNNHTNIVDTIHKNNRYISFF